MKLTFHGADQGVTGSCHLLQVAGKRILVDCGMYQGSHELTEENGRDFGFDPASIDYLFLTHAHLDHCGRIPLLVKRGFRGEIITTSATRDLARLVMLDAAGLQEEEAEYQKRRARRRGRKPDASLEPLYTTVDVLDSLDCFGRRARYDDPIELVSGIRVTFIDAGHILGSAALLFELNDQGQHHRLLFSGDLGFGGRPILRDPEHPPRVDTVVMETTYGDRLHKKLKPSVEELYEAINKTLGRGGNVIIPTFALERAQEVLYYLREGVESRRLEHFMTVFLDSPMAISATEIFARHPECYDENMKELLSHGKDPFAVPGLHFTRQTADSMAINNIEGGAVIMAGSGMCTGGRVRHHLKHNLWRDKSSVIFVGYAAEGTLARRIIDGAERVRIYGEEIQVRAEVYTIGGFSAHADQAQLLEWHRQADPRTTILVHGEPRSMKAFAARLGHDHKVVMPKLGESWKLK